MRQESTLARRRHLPPVPGLHRPPHAGHDALDRARPLILLGEILERGDRDLTVHGAAVGRYAMLIARELGMSRREVELMRIAGTLHDIGKVGVPEHILQKREPLTAGEWAQIRQHPTIGAELLRSAGLDEIVPWVLAHHERPDGNGYPLDLAGTEIPLEARILAVVDSYDAMTTHRVYRRSMPHSEAVEELRHLTGTQFDGTVVEAFLGSLDLQAQRPLVAG